MHALRSPGRAAGRGSFHLRITRLRRRFRGSHRPRARGARSARAASTIANATPYMSAQIRSIRDGGDFRRSLATRRATPEDLNGCRPRSTKELSTSVVVVPHSGHRSPLPCRSYPQVRQWPGRVPPPLHAGATIIPAATRHGSPRRKDDERPSAGAARGRGSRASPLVHAHAEQRSPAHRVVAVERFHHVIDARRG